MTIWSCCVHIYVSTAREQYRSKLDNLGEHLPFIHRERGGGGSLECYSGNMGWNIVKGTLAR